MSTGDTAAVPVTWQALSDQLSPLMNQETARLLSDAERSLKVKAPQLTASRVVGFASRIATIASIAGPDILKPALPGLAESIRKAYSEIEKTGVNNSNGVAAFKLLSTLNDGASCGEEWIENRAAAEAFLLDGVVKQKFTEKDTQTLCFAAIAIGRLDLVPQLSGKMPLKEPFKAGATFGPDYVSFGRYLAIAVTQKASEAEVTPAFESFIDAFPRKRAAQMTEWEDLLWAARIVYCVIGGKPIAEVATKVYAFLHP
jgi:hypothetical protein